MRRIAIDLTKNPETSLEKINKDMAGLGVTPPVNLLNANNPQLILEWWKDYQDEAKKTKDLADQQAKLIDEKTKQNLRDLPNAQQAAQAIQNAQNVAASTKSYNLKKTANKKFAQENQQPPQEEIPTINFNEGIVSLIDFLNAQDFNTAWLEISQYIPKEKEEYVKSSLKSFYEIDWNNVDDMKTKQIESEPAKVIWNSIVPAAKALQDQENLMENAEYKQVSAFVNDVNETIKKIASQNLPAKSYNLKKEAQHKGVENVIMYGPTEKRFDAFLRQPISDYHIVERNKGFGLVVDDKWNIDWEAIWRGSIMDKYSRPYRDTKTGEWIGGYLQKRFEVDKWIPEENNMQLKPGQLRKPYLPEQRGFEARLEAMRKKEADKKGFKPDSNGEPYDWSEEPQYAETKVAKSFNLSKTASSKNDASGDKKKVM